MAPAFEKSSLSGIAAALVLLGLVGSAHAGDGAVVFGRDNALWGLELEGDAEPTLLAKLPVQGALSGLRLDAAARHAVLRVAEQWFWLELESGKSQPLACVDQPQMTPNGLCVLCRVGQGQARLFIMGEKAREYAVEGPGPWAFAGRRSGDKVAVVSGGKLLLTAPRRRGAASKVLADYAPDSMSIAPTGTRAAGNFPDQGDRPAGFYAFRIERNGARRRLMSPAEAVAWSANGMWLLISRESSACLIRSVGGEYKCWDGYQPVALSGSGEEAFLFKGDEPGIYRGLQQGVSASKPRLLVKAATTAAWVAELPATTR